jgi:eukaryotic-like serine/threonine-protein kinase
MNPPKKPNRLIQFSIFEMDLASREFYKQGRKVKMQSQPFEVLAALVDRPGEVVSREELKQQLWPSESAGDFDQGLNKAINKVREALGDSAERPRFVQTLPRLGYRFIGSIQKESGAELGSNEPSLMSAYVQAPNPPTEKLKHQPRLKEFLIAILAPALGVAGYFYIHRTPKLSDKDTIVLADFANSTGDQVFDDTLRQGMIAQLEQSPFLSLVSDERIQKTLALMGQAADVRLTPVLTRDLCERIGSAAVLDGSIATLGSQYVLGLRAVNCRTGDVLAVE